MRLRAEFFDITRNNVCRVVESISVAFYNNFYRMMALSSKYNIGSKNMSCSSIGEVACGGKICK